MRDLVLLIQRAGGRTRREALRGRVHGGIIPPALRRGLIEVDGDEFVLTERGVAIATGIVVPIPVPARVECECGLIIDGRDTAQVEFLRLHRAGDRSVKTCPGPR